MKAPVLKIGDIVQEKWINDIREKDGKKPLSFIVLDVWEDKDEGQMYSCKEGFGCAYDCEVIGNIHENADLLEQ
jgi:hypothetical protein